MKSRIIIAVLLGLFIMAKPISLIGQAVDTCMCPNQEIEITLEKSLDQPQYIYQWQTSYDSINWDTIAGDTLIKCKVTSGVWGSMKLVRCRVTDTLVSSPVELYSDTSLISVYPEPNLDFVNISGLCFGAETSIEISNVETIDANDILWTVNNDSYFRGYPFKTVFQNFGNLTITATIKILDEGCYYDMDSITINVREPSTLSINGNDRVCQKSQYIYDFEGDTGLCTYEWSILPKEETEYTLLGDTAIVVEFETISHGSGYVNISIVETNNNLKCVSGKANLEVLVSEFSAPPVGSIIKKGNGLLIYELPEPENPTQIFTYDDFIYEWQIFEALGEADGGEVPLPNNIDDWKHYLDFGNIGIPFNKDNYNYYVNVGYRDAKLDCWRRIQYVNVEDLERQPVISVFPNPTDVDFVEIDIQTEDDDYSGIEYSVYNSIGVLVRIVESDMPDTRVYLGDMNPGVYLLSASKDGIRMATKKIMISK